MRRVAKLAASPEATWDSLVREFQRESQFPPCIYNVPIRCAQACWPGRRVSDPAGEFQRWQARAEREQVKSFRRNSEPKFNWVVSQGSELKLLKPKVHSPSAYPLLLGGAILTGGSTLSGLDAEGRRVWTYVHMVESWPQRQLEMMHELLKIQVQQHGEAGDYVSILNCASKDPRRWRRIRDDSVHLVNQELLAHAVDFLVRTHKPRKAS